MLTFNINTESGFELHCEVVFPDGYLFEPAFNQGFIKFSKVGTLLLNEVLQGIDSFYLCIPGGGIDGVLPAFFTELENLVCNLIIGFLVVSLFEKLFLEFHQLLVNAISVILLSFSDDFSNILL